MGCSPRAISDLHHQGKTLSSLAEKVNAFHSYLLSVSTSEVVGNLEFLRSELLPRRSTEYYEVVKALSLIDTSKAFARTVFLVDC